MPNAFASRAPRAELAAAALALVMCAFAQKNEGSAPLPLAPTGKLEFTTDEGTWLSLDLSRDGQTLVFDLLGDLYVLPLAGGEAHRITSGLAFDSQPVFSPDGHKIAFTSDRDGSNNLWIANRDGSDAKQLTKERRGDFISPSWTPDGQWVMVSRSTASLGPTEIWMFSVQGGSGVPLMPPGAAGSQQHFTYVGAIAAPDGSAFYCARRAAQFEFSATLPLWQIVRYDRGSGEQDVITNAPGSAFRPVLSPDGSMLVYGTRVDSKTGLRVRNLVTGDDRWLKYPIQRDEQESRATRDVFPGYAFTPDGREVVVSTGGKIQRIDIRTGESTLVPFKARVSLDLGERLRFDSRVEDGPQVRARLIQAPVESPDGKQLAFSALGRLYMTRIPDGHPVRLTSSGEHEFQPAWSADGQYIAYVTWTGNGGHIWKLRMDGRSQPERVTAQPGFYQTPAWSPDGSRIVALRASSRARLEVLGGMQTPKALDVIWIAAAGGPCHLIVPARGAGMPHFGPLTDRVYLNSPEGLQSFRFDGSDRRTHLIVVGKGAGGAGQTRPAQEIRMNPQGGQAVALVTGQLYLLDLPPFSDSAVTVNVTASSVPLKKLTDVGADTCGWADGGKTVTWSLGSSYFRQAASTIPLPAPRDERGQDTAGNNTASADQAPPYQEIPIVLNVPRHTPEGRVVLRGGRVITMRGDEVIRNADIAITGNRITAVGMAGKLPVPPGARVIDVTGTTIMPGIVDVHAHWTEIQRGVLDTENWPFLANLAYGVTSGRDPQTGTNDIFAYQDLVETGEILGPRAYSTGPGIFGDVDLQSLNEARALVTRFSKYYRTNMLKSYVIGNRKQREWLLMACRENRMMPTAEGAVDGKLDLTHAVDGFSGNEHALPMIPLYKDVVELFARTGIFYTPTLIVTYGGPWGENYFYETTEVHGDAKLRRFIPHVILDSRTLRRPWFHPNEHTFVQLAAQAGKIIRAGGNVCIGGHGQLQGLQCHWEMWALAAGGVSAHEVLRAATINGARAIGYAQDLGSIEPGKLADLIVLDKNPLDDVRNTTSIRYVMKNGELFEGNTLNEIWPEKKPLPPLWWWEEDAMIERAKQQ